MQVKPSQHLYGLLPYFSSFTAKRPKPSSIAVDGSTSSNLDFRLPSASRRKPPAHRKDRLWFLFRRPNHTPIAPTEPQQSPSVHTSKRRKAPTCWNAFMANFKKQQIHIETSNTPDRPFITPRERPHAEFEQDAFQYVDYTILQLENYVSQDLDPFQRSRSDSKESIDLTFTLPINSRITGPSYFDMVPSPGSSRRSSFDSKESALNMSDVTQSASPMVFITLDQNLLNMIQPNRYKTYVSDADEPEFDEKAFNRARTTFETTVSDQLSKGTIKISSNQLRQIQNLLKNPLIQREEYASLRSVLQTLLETPQSAVVTPVLPGAPASFGFQHAETAVSLRAMAQSLRTGEKALSIEALQEAIGEISKSSIIDAPAFGYKQFFRDETSIFHTDWKAYKTSDSDIEKNKHSFDQHIQFFKQVTQGVFSKPESTIVSDGIHKLETYMPRHFTDSAITNFLTNLTEFSKRLYILRQTIDAHSKPPELQGPLKAKMMTLLLVCPCNIPAEDWKCLQGMNKRLSGALTASPVLEHMDALSLTVLSQDMALSHDNFDVHIPASGLSLVPGQFSKVNHHEFHALYAWSGNSMDTLTSLSHDLEAYVHHHVADNLDRLADALEHGLDVVDHFFNEPMTIGKVSEDGKAFLGVTAKHIYDADISVAQRGEQLLSTLRQHVIERRYPGISGTFQTLLQPDTLQDMARCLLEDPTDERPLDRYSIIKTLTHLHTALSEDTHTFFATQLLHAFGQNIEGPQTGEKTAQFIIETLDARLTRFTEDSCDIQDPALIKKTHDMLAPFLSTVKADTDMSTWITHGFSAWMRLTCPTSESKLTRDKIEKLHKSHTPLMLYIDKFQPDKITRVFLSAPIKDIVFGGDAHSLIDYIDSVEDNDLKIRLKSNASKLFLDCLVSEK